MERPEGLRRDTLFCYDLLLPADFRPVPNDDEVVGFELWSLQRVAEIAATTDSFKFNVNLVIIDLLIRRGVIPDPEATELRAALQRNAESS
ncbi:MAG: thiamine pyrophosphokinase, partial [Acetobacteraceae bacterium]|nr:thiamine pyrophosphokinase [Acetobacteraceae bacterium]